MCTAWTPERAPCGLRHSIHRGQRDVGGGLGEGSLYHIKGVSWFEFGETLMTLTEVGKLKRQFEDEFSFRREDLEVRIRDIQVARSHRTGS